MILTDLKLGELVYIVERPEEAPQGYGARGVPLFLDNGHDPQNGYGDEFNPDDPNDLGGAPVFVREGQPLLFVRMAKRKTRICGTPYVDYIVLYEGRLRIVANSGAYLKR